MDTGSLRFEIGECVSVNDGALNYPPESFFTRLGDDRAATTNAIGLMVSIFNVGRAGRRLTEGGKPLDYNSACGGGRAQEIRQR